MPRFDFRCTACHTTFEDAIPFGSKKFPKCTACGKKTEKLLGAPPSIQFKGAGFYKTDSAVKPVKAPIKAEETPLRPEGSAGQEKADVKPETKPKNKPDSKPSTKPPTP